jgi:hypothetical protein
MNARIVGIPGMGMGASLALLLRAAIETLDHHARICKT